MKDSGWHISPLQADRSPKLTNKSPRIPDGYHPHDEPTYGPSFRRRYNILYLLSLPQDIPQKFRIIPTDSFSSNQYQRRLILPPWSSNSRCILPQPAGASQFLDHHTSTMPHRRNTHRLHVHIKQIEWSSILLPSTINSNRRQGLTSLRDNLARTLNDTIMYVVVVFGWSDRTRVFSNGYYTIVWCDT